MSGPDAAGLAQEFSHLCVTGLSKRFGGVRAVQDVSFALRRGELAALIGPNGAGKTTVFNLITGLDRPDAGTVYFDRDYLTGLPPHRIVQRGLARTFQNLRLLRELTVLDNVKIAYHRHFRYHVLDAMLRLPRFFREERDIAAKAHRFLELVGLAGLANQRADALPYGCRRRLEIARALATEGSLLLLDEPAAGMNPNETAGLMVLIRQLNEVFGLTILLIEHDMRLVMNLCRRVLVMEHGLLIADGPPAAVRQDPRVIEAYLGPRHAG